MTTTASHTRMILNPMPLSARTQHLLRRQPSLPGVRQRENKLPCCPEWRFAKVLVATCSASRRRCSCDLSLAPVICPSPLCSHLTFALLRRRSRGS